MKKLLIILVILLGASSTYAYECIDFDSKTIQHSVDELFCVSYETKLVPLQMDGQYSLVVDLNKQTDKYDHKAVFKTKGVLLFKSATNKILTVEVIDPAEKEAWTEMQFNLEAQEKIINEKEQAIRALIIEKEELNKNYITTKVELENAKRAIAENQTVHDQLVMNKHDLKELLLEVEREKNTWVGRAWFGLVTILLFGLVWLRDWMRNNSQTGYVGPT